MSRCQAAKIKKMYAVGRRHSDSLDLLVNVSEYRPISSTSTVRLRCNWFAINPEAHLGPVKIVDELLTKRRGERH